jgi:hypothetical protein
MMSSNLLSDLASTVKPIFLKNNIFSLRMWLFFEVCEGSSYQHVLALYVTSNPCLSLRLDIYQVQLPRVEIYKVEFSSQDTFEGKEIITSPKDGHTLIGE